jgi:predicted transcriptional regulator
MNKNIGAPLRVVPLTERNGAARHEDEKLRQIVTSAVADVFEEKAGAMLREMKQTNENLERTVSRLAENLEGIVVGEHDAAIAAVVDEDADDLPSLSRIKADPSVIFRHKATDIAEALGLTCATVSYLLNQNGLDWVRRKPDLWNHEIYKITGARMWYPRIVSLLRDVIDDPQHLERASISSGCENALKRASTARKRAS